MAFSTEAYYAAGFVCGILTMLAIVLMRPALRDWLPSGALGLIAIVGGLWIVSRTASDAEATDAN